MRIQSVVLAVLVICSLTVQAQSTLEQKIDSLLQVCYTNHAFSGEVRLVHKGETIYSGAFKTKDNNTHRYRIGSVTKMFTSVLVYQMIEEGKLSWDTPLSAYYPNIKNAEEITVSMMLSHTSGIFNITGWEDYYTTRSSYFSREQVLQIIGEHKPAFKPGKDSDYSNSNYILLGYMLEDISGKSFADLVQQRIAQPLSLTDTYFETGTPDRTLRELSYYWNGQDWIADVDSDPSLPGAAGAMISTTADLCAFVTGIFDTILVHKSSLDSMQSLVSRQFGHGILKAPFYDHIGWGHTGRIDEFRTFAGYYPEDDLAFSIVSNGMTMDLNDILAGVLAIYYDTTYAMPEFVHCTITEPVTSIFTGDYRAWLFGIIPVGVLQISEATPNHLYMNERGDDPNGRKLLLIRKDAMTFYSPDNVGDLRFEMNKRNKVKRVYLIQGKMEIKCNRL